MIIPNLDSNLWNETIVVGFSGPIASGKTTASQFLESNGFKYIRFSMVLESLLQKRGMEPTRGNLQQIGAEVNQQYGQRWLCQKLIEKVPNEQKIVIDGLNFPEDHAFLVEKFGNSFIHIRIHLDEYIRKKRYIKRGGTEQEFIEASDPTIETKLPVTASLAHQIIVNQEDLDVLFSNIKQVIKCME